MLLVRPGTPRLTAPGNGHHTIAYTRGNSSMRREAVGLVMGQEELRLRARLAYHSPQHHRPSTTRNVRARSRHHEATRPWTTLATLRHMRPNARHACWRLSVLWLRRCQRAVLWRRSNIGTRRLPRCLSWCAEEGRPPP